MKVTLYDQPLGVECENGIEIEDGEIVEGMTLYLGKEEGKILCQSASSSQLRTYYTFEPQPRWYQINLTSYGTNMR